MENITETTIHLFSIHDFHGIIESIRWTEFHNYFLHPKIK
ncbi:hypothetical protein CLFO_24900 [Clostridium formicaceticum]|uniref:Uncharacterized protein n=1 Tax=Clostridium formicaceticum TaxID=1497 RepID=A0AAC9RLW7_9CLOT|nr:hypothetical protein CLFO_24900 [Clostridium formicaceticum]